MTAPALRVLAAALREGTRHRPPGGWRVAIAIGSVAISLYVLYVGAFAPANIHLNIAMFIAIAFPVAFLTTTARRSRTTLNWLDVTLAVLSFAASVYYIVDDNRIQNWKRGLDEITLADKLVGMVLIGLVVELCRRCTGWGLTTLVIALLLYAGFGHLVPGALRHDNFVFSYFIDMMTIGVDGIFGSPLEVAASYAFLFVLFGCFYHRAGGGRLFFDLAGATTGRMTGGAAKACVTASGLYGSVSGSPVADVATTGPLTIPIMKRVGISPARAGAIEATASCGGAMLPPVMGAVAFIMADITSIAYARIAWASLLPAILYYVAIYILVHNQALRSGEGRMAESEIVPLRVAVGRNWQFFLPIAAMIVLLLDGYSPVYVAAGSTAAVILFSWIVPAQGIGPRRFVEACVDTVMQLVPLVGAVAGAGVVFGCIVITGLDGKFQLMLASLAGGLLVPTLIFAAIFLILLGMGMPTVAVYTMGAALLAPTLIGKFNIPALQAHLFMLYFACLSAVTPPVAVANFAAGAIAGVNPMKLGPDAVKLAIGGFVLPFFFVFNPALNLQGGALAVIVAVVFAAATVTFASFALQGWLGPRRIAWPLRLGLIACMVGTVAPRLEWQLGALALGAAALVAVWRLAPVVAAPPGVDRPAGAT